MPRDRSNYDRGVSRQQQSEAANRYNRKVEKEGPKKVTSERADGKKP